jgi:uncharacterized surface protein with fasciclin (FAS1) repeats
MRLHLPLVVLGVTFLVTSAAKTGQADGQKDIVDTAVSAGSFKTLAAALQAADLVEALKGDGPFTVFAPTDDAFAKLPEGTVATLLEPENRDRLTAILTYHVVAGRLPASDVVSIDAAGTLNGQRVDFAVESGRVSVDNATVLQADIHCSNGVIHVIDNVILPSEDDIPTTAARAETFETLLAAATAAGLVDALSGEGPLTVFAPTDEAFAKLPEGTVEGLLKPENKDQLAAILKYHVLSGRVFSNDAFEAGAARTLQGAKVEIGIRDGGAQVNDANLISLDIDASNGVIHVIDSVLLPPEKETVSAADMREMIVDAIHRGVPLFNTGHHRACADIYMDTVQEMVEIGDSMPRNVMVNLQKTISAAEQTHSPTRRAWTLRHALDHAYMSMRGL